MKSKIIFLFFMSFVAYTFQQSDSHSETPTVNGKFNITTFPPLSIS